MPWLLAAFVGGVFVLQQQAALPPPTAIAAALTFALGGGALALWRAAQARSARAQHAALLAAALCSGAAGFAYAAGVAAARLADELAFADEGRDVVVSGVIASLPAQFERGIRFEFAVEESHPAAIHVPQRLSLAWYGSAVRVRPAERWRFTVRLRRPHGNLNPGGFDLEAWMLERGLRAAGYVRDAAPDAPQRLAVRVWQAGPLVDRARDALRERLLRHVGERRFAGVLLALVLGDQRAIGEADWQLFNRTGISHLVSISGLHVTMIAGLAATLAAAAWRRSAWALARAPAQSAAAVAALLAALAYCLLAGWGVPAQRTFFMLAVVAGCRLLRRESHTASTLALAAAIVCGLDPWAAIAPGFWLSFGAVAAILWTLQARRERSGWRGRARDGTNERTSDSTSDSSSDSTSAVISDRMGERLRDRVVDQLRDAVRVQLAVTVALVPLTLALFQQVSTVSPLANALAIPLVSLVVTPLALVAAALVALPAPVDAAGGLLLDGAHRLVELLALVMQWLEQWRWAALAFPAPPPWALAFALLGVAWLLAPPGWPVRWAGIVWLLPLFVVPAERPRPGELWVTALDVGQGMAVLLETAQHAVLYDTGPRYASHSDAGARIIAPYLRWRGIAALDLLVVSHLDSDHSGGAAALLRALRVERTWTSIDAAQMPLQAPRLERCAAGEALRLGALVLRIVHPLAEDYGRRLSTNATSCVLLAELGSTRVLLTGDLPAREERALIGREALGRVRLVTAPHHGSRSSSSAAFVAAVGTDWIVFQAGYRNRFGHPDPSVVDRWRVAGARPVRTDERGAVQWRFAAGHEDVRWTRQVHGRYWHNRPATAPVAASPPLLPPDNSGLDRQEEDNRLDREPAMLDPAGFLLD
jgi:competence protein ComEC